MSFILVFLFLHVDLISKLKKSFSAPGRRSIDLILYPIIQLRYFKAGINLRRYFKMLKGS